MWLVKDSALAISNANATIAHEALKSGANGFWGYSRIFIQTCTDGSRMRFQTDMWDIVIQLYIRFQ